MEKMNGNILKLKKEASDKQQKTENEQRPSDSVNIDCSNKFVTSPNESMRNEEEQHPDYSFGDL